MTLTDQLVLLFLKAFPGDVSGGTGKKPPASAGAMGLIPGPGRFHMLQSK